MSRFYENPPEESAAEPATVKLNRLEVISSFVHEHWKLLLIGGTSAIVLVLAVFLITFFTVRSPSSCLPVTTTTLKTIKTTTSGSTVQSTEKTTTKSTTTTIQHDQGSTTENSQNQICTNQFELINEKCWKFFGTLVDRLNADLVCKKNGGATLVSIKNEKENRELLDFVQYEDVNTIWTGLYCSNRTNVSSCIWDYESGSAKEYDNFDAGFPNTDYGKCVSYNIIGSSVGKWMNVECSNKMALVCELPPTANDDCDYNYDNNCYIRGDFLLNVSAAQQYCESRCSNMASIHSANENRYIWSTVYVGVLGTTWIGGLAPEPDYFLWLDGSPIDYTNLKKVYDGSCLYMELWVDTDGGAWGSFDCTIAGWFLCKHPPGVIC